MHVHGVKRGAAQAVRRNETSASSHFYFILDALLMRLFYGSNRMEANRMDFPHPFDRQEPIQFCPQILYGRQAEKASGSVGKFSFVTGVRRLESSRQGEQVSAPRSTAPAV